jgi:hypothetical protein
VFGDDATSTQSAPADDRMRASDAERRAIVDALSRHTSEGRLQLDEFEDRSSRAFAAVTRGDLRGLLADLPALPGMDHPAAVWAGPVAPAVAVRTFGVRPPRRVGHQWQPFFYVSILLTAIWLMSGGGYFWPMWAIVPLGIGALFHCGKHHDHDVVPPPPPMG